MLIKFFLSKQRFLSLMQVCGAVRSSEGFVPVAGLLEFLITQAANSPPHVLHQEPGTL